MAKQDEDNIGKKLDLADSWLTNFGIILKKHWGKLLFLLFCYCVYWAFTQPTQKQSIQEYVYSTPVEDDSTYYYETDSI